MKTLLIFLTMAAIASAENTALIDRTSLPTSGTLKIPEISPFINIACGNGFIKINCTTGEVKLPEGVKMDEAAREFWRAVAEAFPEMRRAMIRGATP